VSRLRLKSYLMLLQETCHNFRVKRQTNFKQEISILREKVKFQAKRSDFSAVILSMALDKIEVMKYELYDRQA